jgi:hypothetical protein
MIGIILQILNKKGVAMFNIKRLTFLLVLILSVPVLQSCHGGPCHEPSDRASDGSRCGGRAASERPGGSFWDR